jgi:hypothetical protein
MPGTVTITGTAGAGLAVTAVPFTNVSQVTIDFDKNMVHMVKDSVNVPGIAVAAAATVTATKSGNTWTLTIS